jgi:hypothetical protein
MDNITVFDMTTQHSSRSTTTSQKEEREHNEFLEHCKEREEERYEWRTLKSLEGRCLLKLEKALNNYYWAERFARDMGWKETVNIPIDIFWLKHKIQSAVKIRTDRCKVRLAQLKRELDSFEGEEEIESSALVTPVITDSEEDRIIANWKEKESRNDGMNSEDMLESTLGGRSLSNNINNNCDNLASRYSEHVNTFISENYATNNTTQKFIDTSDNNDNMLVLTLGQLREMDGILEDTQANIIMQPNQLSTLGITDTPSCPITQIILPSHTPKPNNNYGFSKLLSQSQSDRGTKNTPTQERKQRKMEKTSQKKSKAFHFNSRIQQTDEGERSEKKIKKPVQGQKKSKRKVEDGSRNAPVSIIESDDELTLSLSGIFSLFCT